jgi:TonB-dependent Receptor Plug Domain/Gram-negative bacterial TonB protein C-terminal
MMKKVTVIVIALFSFSIAVAQDTSAVKIKRNDSATLKNTPLYLLNGIEIKQSDLNNLSPHDIEKVNVLKDSNAVKKYGNRGINGVVEIILKKEFVERELNKMFPKSQSPKAEEMVESKVFTAVEIGSYYKGDIRKFILDNLKDQTDVNGKRLTGNVMLQFVVNINGTISDIKVDISSESKIEKLIDEAIRVIKLTNGNWVGAEQNGRKLEKAFHYQNFLFK